MLSNETALLAEHWDAVEDVFATEQKLRAELTGFLNSLQHTVKKEKWWSDDWHFKLQDHEQAYIAHTKWRTKSDFVLWIGVERFSPNVLFGRESAPALYLWVKDNAQLTEELRRLVKDKQLLIPGELAEKPHGYVARQFIPKCLAPEVKRFEEFVGKPIIDFFSACAAQEKLLSSKVAQYLKEK